MRLLLIALLIAGCSSLPDPTVVPTEAPIPSPSPTPVPATQSDVLAAVGRWVTSSRESRGAPEWVLSEFESGAMGTDLAVSGDIEFEPEMTDESRAALDEALRGIEFIDDTDQLEDPGNEVLGCHYYRDGDEVLHLTAPRLNGPEEHGYSVGVEIERGCQGELMIVVVTRDETGQFAVTHVDNKGFWIV